MTDNDAGAAPTRFSDVRLTATDIHHSKAFYTWLFGLGPGCDFSKQIDEPGVREDPNRTYDGCSFTFHGQTLGPRPVARAGDRFDPDRFGLDHVSFLVESVEDLHAAADRLQQAGVTHGTVTELPAFGLRDPVAAGPRRNQPSGGVPDPADVTPAAFAMTAT